MDHRNELIGEANKTIEQDLQIFGSTAIEDRLQEDVPETISFLKAAGIKVWVLTGDKVSTAINIGKAAGLIDKNKKYVEMRSVNK